MGKKKLKRRQTSFKSGYFKKKATGLRQADDINEVQEALKRLPLSTVEPRWNNGVHAGLIWMCY